MHLGFQGFAQELADLPDRYAPPSARLLLATVDGQPAGCVALRPLDGGDCEVKRLHVRPQHRGTGMGRALAERVIQEAGDIGYDRIRLDTIPSMMSDAVMLYRALGFETIAPYCDNPIAEDLFLELWSRHQEAWVGTLRPETKSNSVFTYHPHSNMTVQSPARVYIIKFFRPPLDMKGGGLNCRCRAVMIKIILIEP